ncbi:50S ribosomal protein L5 [Candidatus Micrarchaeota archaeon]|nr:50S ribosomal protein L5 [Candidatus Micrarchaeota archaeon]
MTDNPMRKILIDKVTVNIGVGSPGDRLENAKTLLSKLSGAGTPVETKARKRDPVFKLRKGLPIGAKITLRGAPAKTFLEKALAAKRRTLKESNFDRRGNFAFGVHEYIDFPGAKYDPTIGMFGFDICVTLRRPGNSVALRRLSPSKIGAKHLITPHEAREFIKNSFNVKFE